MKYFDDFFSIIVDESKLSSDKNRDAINIIAANRFWNWMRQKSSSRSKKKQYLNKLLLKLELHCFK